MISRMIRRFRSITALASTLPFPFVFDWLYASIWRSIAISGQRDGAGRVTGFVVGAGRVTGFRFEREGDDAPPAARAGSRGG